ncbi:MAG: class I SAM-dependent methyltransferase [Bacillota bacterium]
MLTDFLERAVLPFSDGGCALEFGCGPGPVLGDLLRGRGFTVDLYDPFFYPAEDYLDCSYDLVTSTEVFEHLSRPREVLCRLCRVIRPGGTLAIMTHLHPGRRRFADWWYHRDPTHVTFYSRETLNWICKQWPLTLLYTDSFKLATFRREEADGSRS